MATEAARVASSRLFERIYATNKVLRDRDLLVAFFASLFLQVYLWRAFEGLFPLEPVREQFDSLEQFVIQESDLILEAADVDARESRALRPKPVALSQRSDRRGMGACGAADPAS